MIQRFADWLVYDIFGLDASTALGKAINFFFYDTIKILILLFFISVIMGIINAYFPIERLRNYLTSRKLYVHIPADTRSAFPVISVQSPVSIQCCWQS